MFFKIIKRLLLFFVTTFVGCTLADESTPVAGTIILPGMPHLEWMTENLSGHGGTEIDGRWYYTYDEAVAAVKQLGDGWRLPTRAEWEALCDLGSEWQEEGPHGLPGRLFGGNLFLEAAGYLSWKTGALASVGAGGYAWSSSYVSAATGPAGFAFKSSDVYPLDYADSVHGLSVRCVRDVGAVPSPELPRLEWMTENLQGFGGTEIDGRWYYNYDEAEEAVKQLGDGWRLPTRGEWEALCDLGSTWDATRKGRWFGGNHATDHAGSLFLPAAGHFRWDTGAMTDVGKDGYYWSSSRSYMPADAAGGFGFNSALVDPMGGYYCTSRFSVRCVREML